MMRPEPVPVDDLFADDRRAVVLAEGAVLLDGFAVARSGELLAGIGRIAAEAPFRRMATPGGGRMSVAMTNCGNLGWVTDRSGYRYTAADPETGRPWPAMPEMFRDLAASAAAAAGCPGFDPDACLVNRYEPGSRMGRHQDRDERDLSAPIVSVSLGLPAAFLWGGPSRRDRPTRVRLVHGDVVVWGGPARLAFHGVDTLRGDGGPEGVRYNLTFRRRPEAPSRQTVRLRVGNRSSGAIEVRQDGRATRSPAHGLHDLRSRPRPLLPPVRFTRRRAGRAPSAAPHRC